jgi:hypothetical protein
MDIYGSWSSQNENPGWLCKIPREMTIQVVKVTKKNRKRPTGSESNEIFDHGFQWMQLA